MTSEPRAFLALDLGTATTSVALLGRIDARWRLIGSRAAPASIPVDALVTRLLSRLVADDAGLMAEIGLPDPAGADGLVRLVARSRPAPRLAVLAGSDRTLHGLLAAANRAGWRPSGLSAERADALEITQLVLDHTIGTVLLGADDPPGADERARLAELGQLLAAAASRRPELRIVLAGGARGQADAVGPGVTVSAGPERAEATTRPAVGRSDDAGDGETAPTDGYTDASADAEPAVSSLRGDGGGPPNEATGTASEAVIEEADGGDAARTVADESLEAARADAAAIAQTPERADDRNGREEQPPAVASHPSAAGARDERRIVAPAPFDATGGGALRDLLESLRAAPDDARLATVRAVGTLASVLQLGVELIDIGHAAGQRVVAIPVGEGDGAHVRLEAATVADAALVPPDAADDHVDEVLAWSTTSLDRYRLRDRLRELRLSPWSDAAGEGALVRAAAARAAIGRLLHATLPASGRYPAPPDLIVAAGGAWATVPGPAVTLALADLVRRPAACQCAIDSGRLLGPLGMIEDEHDRIRVVRDLVDDMLVPLGSVVTPQGVRAGRGVGRATLRDADRATDVDLVAGGLQLLDLPPGRRATLDLVFRDPVVLGARGREFQVDVAGGLSGLIVDLRDVPLRLPDRAERRRELLGAWQRALWVGLE